MFTNIDGWAIDIVQQFFENEGYTVTVTENPYDNVDLVDINGKYAIEVKGRKEEYLAKNIKDNMLDVPKYNLIMNAVDQRKYKAVYLCNVFKDNTFYLNNILKDEPMNTNVKDISKTTYFENKEKQPKQCFYYNPKITVTYTPTDDGRYTFTKTENY